MENGVVGLQTTAYGFLSLQRLADKSGVLGLVLQLKPGPGCNVDDIPAVLKGLTDFIASHAEAQVVAGGTCCPDC